MPTFEAAAAVISSACPCIRASSLLYWRLCCCLRQAQPWAFSISTPARRSQPRRRRRCPCTIAFGEA
ncbi:hypothetical protein M0R45_025923 [Rubus argutus]|uniref:Secreted protein n=1 Tax=Rubus argutus TaxID=59490 RepID=A0AAW1WXT6_RUBAR